MNHSVRTFRVLTVAAWLILVFSGTALAANDVYTIDKDHSTANWTIRHVVSKTTGTFANVQGKIEIDPEKKTVAKAEAVVDIFSLDSHNRERDAHLLTSEFFSAHEFNTIRFTSTEAQSTGANTGVLRGKLTLHGVTRDIEFPFEILGFGPDPWGGYRVGFQASTRLKRSDYGMRWGLDMPGGGPVGDEVDVTLYIEGVRQTAGGKVTGKTP